MKEGQKIMMIVQGEGRGHLSQAIAMKEILENQGFIIVSVITGKSFSRKIPDYFFQAFQNEVVQIESPGLVLSHDLKKVLLFKTFIINLLRIPFYLRQVRVIHREYQRTQPDLILNFHEILCGFWYLFYKPGSLIVSIAHQYIYYHYRFSYPRMPFLHKLSLELVNFFTTLGSKKRLALHFFQWDKLSRNKLLVMPPLIRKQIRELKSENQHFILVYLLYPGLADEIRMLQKKFPDAEFHVFWSKDDYTENQRLRFLSFSQERFLDELQNCRMFLTTAGFEGIAESYYLGKPAGVVAAPNHPEQNVNASETELSGAGKAYSQFKDIDIQELKNLKYNNSQFRQWVDTGHELFVNELKRLLVKHYK